jgi:hypothetical protein
LAVWWMSGQRPRRGVEAVASRSRAGRCFMGWSRCLLGLGDSLVSLVR